MVSLRPPPLYPARTEGRMNYIRSTFHPFNEGHQKACPDKTSAPTTRGPSPPHHKGKDWHLPEEISSSSHPRATTEPGSEHGPWPTLGTLLGWQQVHLAPLLPQWLCSPLRGGAPCSLVNQMLLENEHRPLCFAPLVL